MKWRKDKWNLLLFALLPPFKHFIFIQCFHSSWPFGWPRKALPSAPFIDSTTLPHQLRCIHFIHFALLIACHSVHQFTNFLPFLALLVVCLFGLVFSLCGALAASPAHNPQIKEIKERRLIDSIPAHQTTPSIHQQANGELIGLLFCGLAGLFSALH